MRSDEIPASIPTYAPHEDPTMPFFNLVARLIRAAKADRDWRVTGLVTTLDGYEATLKDGPCTLNIALVVK